MTHVWIMVATLDGDADTCVRVFASRDAAIALAKNLANEESDSGATEEDAEMENLRLIREQAAAYREIAPFLDRLHKLSSRRGWPLGRNILACAVEELEHLTPSTTH